ncbi:MAG: DUF1552 domain-containing protein [Chthonomonadales bacterium]
MDFGNRPLTRRTVLKGAGAMLSLPFLEAMLPSRASASVAPPKRLGIFSVTGGTVLESWKPSTVGPLGKLPSILRPLDGLQSDFMVLSGLSNSGNCDSLNGHENCAYKHLTAVDFAKKEGGKIFAGVSLDQCLAQRLGDQSYLPSIEMGINLNLYSFRDANTPVFSEANPRFVFDRMFRGRKPVVPNWFARTGKAVLPANVEVGTGNPDQGVIDVLLEQAKDLRRQLGRDDQQKLDGYLSSVHSVEGRMRRLEARLRQELLDAQNPGPSKLVKPTLYPENIPFYKISGEVERDPEKHGEYIAILSDLMVLAFQTDSTRVVTLAAGSDEAHFPGVITVGYETHCHTLEHQGNADRVENADPVAREACRQIHTWYTSLFAETVRKMKSIDEGGSSLLDNTTLLYTSYMSDGGHGMSNYPVVLAGRGGGTLKPGKHIDFGKDVPMSNLYTELINNMGVKCEEFGNNKSTKNVMFGGRLPGLG